MHVERQLVGPIRVIRVIRVMRVMMVKLEDAKRVVMVKWSSVG